MAAKRGFCIDLKYIARTRWLSDQVVAAPNIRFAMEGMMPASLDSLVLNQAIEPFFSHRFYLKRNLMNWVAAAAFFSLRTRRRPVAWQTGKRHDVRVMMMIKGDREPGHLPSDEFLAQMGGEAPA